MAYADLSDVRCYYEILGQGDPLLLIPGLGVTCRSWDCVVPELSRHFTLVLPDNRGLGLSESKRQPHTLADYAADMVELLDHLQIDRAHVMGLSLGGIIAQRFVIDHPSRVERLVLVSCADRFSPYLKQVAIMLKNALRRFPWEAFVRSVELLGSSPDFVDHNEDLLEERIRAKCAVKADRRTVANQLRCLASSEVEPERYRIAPPTLVIAGDDDRLIPCCYARKMSEKIPGSQFIAIPRCGHNPFQEMPEETLNQVIKFLRQSRVVPATVGHADCTFDPAEMCV